MLTIFVMPYHQDGSMPIGMSPKTEDKNRPAKDHGKEADSSEARTDKKDPREDQIR